MTEREQRIAWSKRAERQALAMWLTGVIVIVGALLCGLYC